VIVLAVPVKDLVTAKQRLARLLTPAERRALARAMLADVLRAAACARVDRVWVVTREPETAALARVLGAEPVAEDDNRGHTAAVAAAQAAARRAGARVFATIPGDVPCVTGDEIRTLVEAVAGGGVAFAPSRSGLGTNGAALAPVDVMPLRFGEPSFEDHLAAARARGLTPRVLHLPGLALDVDGPADIRALRAETADTESGRLVAGWALDPRLLAAAGRQERIRLTAIRPPALPAPSCPGGGAEGAVEAPTDD
jgi:2-phospho-L-lactate guanylyltransferase